MRYAKVDPSNVVREYRSDKEIDPTVPTKTGWRWLPVVEAVSPAIDVATETLLPPVTTVNANNVTLSVSKRSLTAQELSERKDAMVASLERQELLFKIAFNQENRIRALEGKAAVTAAQYRAALKAQL